VFNAAPKNFVNYLLLQLQKFESSIYANTPMGGYSINHERWALKGH